MTALQFLRASRAHIDKPHKWVKYTLQSPMGSVCSVGALQKTWTEIHGHRPSAMTAHNDWLEGDILAAVTYLCEAIGAPEIPGPERYTMIANFNDDTCYNAVMMMWDRAIELAEADEEIETISIADLIEELAPA